MAKTETLSVAMKNGFEFDDLSEFWEKICKLNEFDSKCFINLVEDTNELTVLKILARFSESLKTGQQTIEQAIKSGNCEEIWRVCHKVAGSAELIGFKSYGDVARELNHQLQANPKVSGHLLEIESFLIWTKNLSEQIADSFPNLYDYMEA